MPALSDQQLDHLARLARLKLTAEEKSRFGPQLQDILGYMGILEEVNDVSESVPLVSGVSELREDAPRVGKSSEEGHFIEIPPVFKQTPGSRIESGMTRNASDPSTIARDDNGGSKG